LICFLAYPLEHIHKVLVLKLPEKVCTDVSHAPPTANITPLGRLSGLHTPLLQI
jgi:hypothetical protein